MSKIKITLNGEDYYVVNNRSINDLIIDLGLDLKKIAIEKNLEIILPENFSKTAIMEGDKIEIVSFIGGG